MKIKYNHTATYLILQTISFAISIFLFNIIIINHSPNSLRALSMTLRSGFGMIIPIVTILIYLTFRIPGHLGNIVSMAFVTSLFAMPLAGLWASGQTQSTVLNGVIPLYDAESYYIDALGLLNGSDFSIFSARRPLFPGLLAVLLSWTGRNLMTSLAILTAIVGFSCYFAAREIQRTHGPEMATLILIILFLFFRAHSGVSMSENLGVALGVLGFTLLWQGASSKSIFYILAGLFVTTIALNARAGAFFMLPLLVLWTGWLFRGNNKINWKFVVLALGAIVIGFASNLIITRMIAVPSGIPFANFSYTFYGLASGGNSWAYIFDVHPEVLSIQEPEKTKRIYELAFELILTKPWLTLQGALFNWKMLFSDSWYNIYAYVSGENWIINVIARWALYLLSIMGIYSWSRDKSDSIKSLIMVSLLGVFISVPFLPPTDAYRMRPYAASIIILGATPALGLNFIFQQLKTKFFMNKEEVKFPYSSALMFSVGLLAITLIGPIIIKWKSQPVKLQPVACTFNNSDFIMSQFNDGTYINIKKQNLSFLDWMPNFHIGQFKENAHSLADENIIDWAESLQAPLTIFLTLDLNTNQKVLVAFKTEDVLKSGEYYQFCGGFETSPSLESYRIFYADEALLLPP